MSRYLIEVSEQSGMLARRRIMQSVRTMGSHFATHARWIQKDGTCTGTLEVEVSDSLSALGLVPPNMRDHAHVVPLDTMP